MQLTLSEWLDVKYMTGKELAIKAGVAEATISHIRQNKFKPRIGTLKAIAEALEIKIEDIKL